MANIYSKKKLLPFINTLLRDAGFSEGDRDMLMGDVMPILLDRIGTMMIKKIKDPKIALDVLMLHEQKKHQEVDRMIGLHVPGYEQDLFGILKEFRAEYLSEFLD